MSDNCVVEDTKPAPDGTRYAGKNALTQFWQNFFLYSPNARIEIEDVFGLGNRCIMRWKYNWVDVVGKKEHVQGVGIFKVKNGSTCEKVSYVKG